MRKLVGTCALCGALALDARAGAWRTELAWQTTWQLSALADRTRTLQSEFEQALSLAPFELETLARFTRALHAIKLASTHDDRLVRLTGRWKGPVGEGEARLERLQKAYPSAPSKTYRRREARGQLTLAADSGRLRGTLEWVAQDFPHHPLKDKRVQQLALDGGLEAGAVSVDASLTRQLSAFPQDSVKAEVQTTLEATLAWERSPLRATLALERAQGRFPLAPAKDNSRLELGGTCRREGPHGQLALALSHSRWLFPLDVPQDKRVQAFQVTGARWLGAVEVAWALEGERTTFPHNPDRDQLQALRTLRLEWSGSPWTVSWEALLGGRAGPQNPTRDRRWATLTLTAGWKRDQVAFQADGKLEQKRFPHAPAQDEDSRQLSLEATVEPAEDLRLTLSSALSEKGFPAAPDRDRTVTTFSFEFEAAF